MARKFPAQAQLALDKLKENVHEDILAALGMDEDKIDFHLAQWGGLHFCGTQFYHTLNGAPELADGKIIVCFRDNEKFSVYLEVEALRQSIVHDRLSGAQLEDLLIELADI